MSLNTISPGGFVTSLLIGDTTQTANASSDSIPQMTQVGGVTVAAAFEIQSTSGSLLLPRLTTAQMNALTPVVNGMMIYNTDNNVVTAYENGVWVAVGSGGGGSVSQLNQGSNIVLTPNPITAVGTIALSPTLAGLTSAVIGNISININPNTISSTTLLNINSSNTTNVNITGQIITLNPTAGVLIRNGSGLFFENAANTNSVSFAAGAINSNTAYTLPLNYPTINGQFLSSTTLGTMSWTTAGTGTVTSITAGSNLTGGTITTSGTIGLSATPSGLTSLGVGSWSLSGTQISSSGIGSIVTIGNLTLAPTNSVLVNAGLQVRANNTLALFNSGNTNFTALQAGATAANATYTLPLTVPSINGQVLSSTTGGTMSWVSTSTGTVTSITASANIICSPNPITGSGTIQVDPNLSGLNSVGVGNLTITDGVISEPVGTLSISSANSLTLSSSIGEVLSGTNFGVRSNLLLKLYNAGNTAFTAFQAGATGSNFTYTLPTTAPSINGQVLSSTTAGVMSWSSSGGAPSTSKYILQQPDGSLPNAQSLSVLANGILKSTTATGVISIATAGIDYYGPGNPTFIEESTVLDNLFIGFSAGSLATGTSNVGYGTGSFANLTTGSRNVAVGAFAGSNIVAQNDNTYVGNNVSPNASGTANTFMGSAVASSLNTSSSNNTWIGFSAGSAATSASNSTLLGNATVISSGLTNATAIGYQANVSASHSVVLGTNCNIGINIGAPLYALHINNTGPTPNANLFLANTTNAPTTPTGGGALYTVSGALIYVGSSGTTTVIAPA